MIKYPDELKKLKEEIDDNFEDEGSLVIYSTTLYPNL